MSEGRQTACAQLSLHPQQLAHHLDFKLKFNIQDKSLDGDQDSS